MKKEIAFGLGIAALIFYLMWKEERDKNKNKGAGASPQPQSTFYWGFPLGYGGGGDVNQNVNVYQQQGTMSTATPPIIQSTPVFPSMGGKGGGKGR